jgi:hypothetical protein
MLNLRSFNRFILINLALLGLSVSSVNAATLTHIDAGTYRDQVVPGDSFIDNVFFASNYPSLSIEDRGVIEFDISSLAAPVGLATIDFTIALNSGVAPSIYELYGYEGDGDVSLTSGDFDAGTMIPGSGFTITNEAVGTVISVDVTSSINSLIGLSAVYAGFNLRHQPMTVYDEFEYLGASNWEGITSPYPVLEVSAVPVPAAVWLFGTALIGLIGLGKRKSRIAA